MNWQGEIAPQGELRARGQWTVAATMARTPDALRADELAATLSLAPALSVVPVAEYFSSDLTRMVRDFLVGSDVQGKGAFEYGSDGFTLSPDGSVTLKTARNQLSLTPRADGMFYSFDRASQSIRAQMDAVFIKPVGLRMTAIDLMAGSQDGFRLDGIKRFSARIGTSANWRSQDASGRTRPFGAIINGLKLYRRITSRALAGYDARL